MHPDGAPEFAIGDAVSISRTVSESDVYLFGGITGDLGRNHFDAEWCKNTAYGERVVHGAFLVGLASAASSAFSKKFDKGVYRGASYGYDRVRFVSPVFIGDTVTMTYTLESADEDARMTYANVIGKTQRGTVCFAATHISKGLRTPQ